MQLTKLSKRFALIVQEKQNKTKMHKNAATQNLGVIIY